MKSVRFNLSKIFGAFSIRELQSFRNIAMQMIEYGLSLEEVFSYVSWLTPLPKLPVVRACPHCESPMKLERKDLSTNDLRLQWVCHGCSAVIQERRSGAALVKHLERRVRKKDPLPDFTIPNRSSRTCKSCGGEQGLYRIKNDTAGMDNKYGYKCRWYCKDCSAEDLKKSTILEELIRLRHI